MSVQAIHDSTKITTSLVSGYTSEKSRFSAISNNSSFLNRAAFGILDIARAVVSAAMAPLQIFFLGNPEKGIFDLANLPITILRSIASLSGSTSVSNAFESLQDKIQNSVLNYFSSVEGRG